MGISISEKSCVYPPRDPDLLQNVMLQPSTKLYVNRTISVTLLTNKPNRKHSPVDGGNNRLVFINKN